MEINNSHVISQISKSVTLQLNRSPFSTPKDNTEQQLAHITEESFHFFSFCTAVHKIPVWSSESFNTVLAQTPYSSNMLGENCSHYDVLEGSYRQLTA